MRMIGELQLRQVIDGEEFVEVTTFATCDRIRRKSYLISRTGRVYSLISNRFLNPTVDSNGYLIVNLQLDDGTSSTFYIHRMVMIVFEFRPDYDQLQVNHKDTIKSHSYKNNLEWVTCLGNVEHAYNNNLLMMGEKCSWSLLSEAQVREICVRLQNNDYTSITDLANEYNCAVTTIGDIARGRSWRHVSKDYNINYEVRTKFTDEQVHFMCKTFSENKDKPFSYSYYFIIFNLGLEDSPQIRKRIAKIHRKDPMNFANITSLYDY